jgi:DNA polymerase-3 subunit delta
MMNYDQILAEIKNRVYKPVYFLMGEEPYFIDKITDLLVTDVLAEEQKAFNLNILYGKDTDVNTIDSTARRFPMGAEYNLVIVREAQNLEDIERLNFYAQSPLHSTILVIAYKYKTLDARKKLYKTINKNGVLFEAKKIYDNQVPRWIQKYLEQRNRSIEPSAGIMLTEFLGSDLSKISHELDKLLITLPEGETRISPDHVETNIGISKEFNNFELMKALAKKNVLKANRIIQYFGQNQRVNSINMTISSLFYFFSKVLAVHFMRNETNANIAKALHIPTFFVGDYLVASRNYSRSKVVEIISILREFDLKSKGYNSSSVPPDELLQEMIFKILH